MSLSIKRLALVLLLALTSQTSIAGICPNHYLRAHLQEALGFQSPEILALPVYSQQQMLARRGFQYLGQMQGTQEEKVRAWTKIVDILDEMVDGDGISLTYVADRFAGSDGSIVFQGGSHFILDGVSLLPLLVFKRDGTVWKGGTKKALRIWDPLTREPQVWTADYSNFKLLGP